MAGVVGKRSRLALAPPVEGVTAGRSGVLVITLGLKKNSECYFVHFTVSQKANTTIPSEIHNYIIAGDEGWCL